MTELGLSSTYDYSTATSNRKKSIFLVIGVSDEQALVTRSIHLLLKEGVAGKTRACGYLAPNDPTAA
jgi:hypothetical protein